MVSGEMMRCYTGTLLSLEREITPSPKDFLIWLRIKLLNVVNYAKEIWIIETNL